VNKESRADWDSVLRTRGLSRQMFSPQMQLAVGVFNAKGNAAYVMALPPVGADTTNSQLEFHLQLISWDGWTIFGVIVLVGAVIGFLYMLGHSGIVRDTTCPVREDGLPPLSLGRCQMAFWFFLAISAFFYIWEITGRGDTDSINSTVLILIGISAGTGLGAAIISKNQAETAAAGGAAAAVGAPTPTPTPPATPTPTPTPNPTPTRTPLPSQPAVVVYPVEIKIAKTELANAMDDRKKIDPNNTAAIAASDAKIKAHKSEVANWKRALKLWRARNRGQLLKDLLSEEEGEGRVITFHRFQIVVWTMVLGVVFVSEVSTKLAMPVFDNTLLTLMGISSGTYLGFKVSK